MKVKLCFFLLIAICSMESYADYSLLRSVKCSILNKTTSSTETRSVKIKKLANDGYVSLLSFDVVPNTLRVELVGTLTTFNGDTYFPLRIVSDLRVNKYLVSSLQATYPQSNSVAYYYSPFGQQPLPQEKEISFSADFIQYSLKCSGSPDYVSTRF